MQSVLTRLPLAAAAVLVLSAWLAVIGLPAAVAIALAVAGPGPWLAGLGYAWVVAAGTAGGLVVRGTG